jgi:hypothetical protein
MHHRRAHPRKIPGPHQENGNHFNGFTREYIERNKNSESDESVKAAAHNTPLPTNVFFQVVPDASIKIVKEPRVINLIEGDWCTPIMAYLRHYYKPDSTTEHTKMLQRAKAYQIIDNNMYKTSISGPLLRCVSKAEG